MLRVFGIARDHTSPRRLGGTPYHHILRSFSLLRSRLCSMALSSTPFLMHSCQNGVSFLSRSSRRSRSSSIDRSFTARAGVCAFFAFPLLLCCYWEAGVKCGANSDEAVRVPGLSGGSCQRQWCSTLAAGSRAACLLLPTTPCSCCLLRRRCCCCCCSSARGALWAWLGRLPPQQAAALLQSLQPLLPAARPLHLLVVLSPSFTPRRSLIIFFLLGER